MGRTKFSHSNSIVMLGFDFDNQLKWMQEKTSSRNHKYTIFNIVSKVSKFSSVITLSLVIYVEGY